MIEMRGKHDVLVRKRGITPRKLCYDVRSVYIAEFRSIANFRSHGKGKRQDLPRLGSRKDFVRGVRAPFKGLLHRVDAEKRFRPQFGKIVVRTAFIVEPRHLRERQVSDLLA